MALSDLTTSAILKAVQEYNDLGQAKFLQKYKFGKARNYVLQLNGHSYDSKAIAGAAHGFLPGQTPLKASQFSGGDATVKKKLEELGFPVIRDPDGALLRLGDVISNEEIGRRFGVGNMGGMRRNTDRNLLVLISDPFKGLYQDRWDGDILHYTGMGRSGDQSLNSAQNRTLAESPTTGITLHLLEARDPMKYTYAGEVTLAGAPYQEDQLDESGKNRKVWMFPIELKEKGRVPFLTAEQAWAIEDAQARTARKLSTKQLRDRAKKAKKEPARRLSQTSVFVRDQAVVEYVKRLASGLCDLCEAPAPFHNKQKEAYLECHHVIWLAKGGEDTIANTVALCPNCHRKMHVLNAKSDQEKLGILAVSRAT